MNRQSDSLLIRGAIVLALYAPAVALLSYFVGGTLPVVFAPLGADGPSGSIFGLYGNFCHQMPERSFQFGGAQLGFCSRCSGLYGSLALFSLLIAITGKTKPILWIWLLLLCLPMILDVVFDLSASSGLNNVPRVATGALAGAGISLFVYPRLVSSVRYSLAPERDA